MGENGESKGLYRRQLSHKELVRVAMWCREEHVNLNGQTLDVIREKVQSQVGRPVSDRMLKGLLSECNIRVRPMRRPGGGSARRVEGVARILDCFLREFGFASVTLKKIGDRHVFDSNDLQQDLEDLKTWASKPKGNDVQGGDSCTIVSNDQLKHEVSVRTFDKIFGNRGKGNS